MKLIYEVKPRKRIGATRSDAIPSVIKSGCFNIGSNNIVYGYNLEKQRRKCVHKTKKKRNGEVVKYSEPIRPNQYYYAFDYQVLKALGLRG